MSSASSAWASLSRTGRLAQCRRPRTMARADWFIPATAVSQPRLPPATLLAHPTDGPSQPVGELRHLVGLPGDGLVQPTNPDLAPNSSAQPVLLHYRVLVGQAARQRPCGLAPPRAPPRNHRWSRPAEGRGVGVPGSRRRWPVRPVTPRHRPVQQGGDGAGGDRLGAGIGRGKDLPNQLGQAVGWDAQRSEVGRCSQVGGQRLQRAWHVARGGAGRPTHDRRGRRRGQGECQRVRQDHRVHLCMREVEAPPRR